MLDYIKKHSKNWVITVKIENVKILEKMQMPSFLSIPLSAYLLLALGFNFLMCLYMI